jgi:hypothetical protein
MDRFRRIVKKLAQEKKPIQKKKKQFRTNNPLEKPCPNGSTLLEGESCSPLMNLMSFGDYWFNIQKQELKAIQLC